MPFFSVIIPSYNRVAFVRATLSSVAAQEYKDFEVFVVDDGSTDGTIEALRAYPWVKVLRQQNQGPGVARNHGVRMASGQYIAFLDSDDLWFPWTLATYARIIREQAEPTLIAGRLVYFSEEYELSNSAFAPLAMQCFSDYFAACRRGLYCGTCQMVVRRDALLEVGGFADTQINAEDHDLVMRLGTAPGFVNVTAPALIGYRQHAESATKDCSKTFAGLSHLLQMEQAGRYPGGKQRQWERRQILTRHVRPLTLDLLRQRDFQRAWNLYRRTFLWNLALGRLRYLAGFFVRAALS